MHFPKVYTSISQLAESFMQRVFIVQVTFAVSMRWAGNGGLYLMEGERQRATEACDRVCLLGHHFCGDLDESPSYYG